MIVNEVPEWLPIVNLVLRATGFCLILAYIIRRHGRVGIGEPKWITLETTAVLAALVLVAGALFQANWLSLSDWTIIGTWGSAMIVVVALLLLAWRD